MKRKNKRGGWGSFIVKDMIKTAVINYATAKIKEKIRKKIKRSGKPMTPERVGRYIGRKYIARKRDTRTRAQKRTDKWKLAGKLMGKGTYTLASAIQNIGK